MIASLNKLQKNREKVLLMQISLFNCDDFMDVGNHAYCNICHGISNSYYHGLYVTVIHQTMEVVAAPLRRLGRSSLISTFVIVEIPKELNGWDTSDSCYTFSSCCIRTHTHAHTHTHTHFPCPTPPGSLTLNTWLSLHMKKVSTLLKVSPRNFFIFLHVFHGDVIMWLLRFHCL
jgi:hypothetical protein